MYGCYPHGALEFEDSWDDYESSDENHHEGSKIHEPIIIHDGIRFDPKIEGANIFYFFSF